jgi:PEP-CTERM motif
VKIRTTLVCLALIATATQAAASPVTGVFNTGVNAAGSALTGGNGVADPHWQVGRVQAVTYFNGSYQADTAASRWISLSAEGGPNAAGTNFYALSLTFDLTGFNPATARLSGRWSADNCGNIDLNGVTSSGLISTCNDASSFQNWTSFSFTSGFVAGINTISIFLQNTGGPTAARLEFLLSSVDPIGGNSAPEPATLALLGLALIGAGWMRSRKR